MKGFNEVVPQRQIRKLKDKSQKKIKDGEEIAILSFGHAGNFVLNAEETFEKEGLNLAHYDMRFAKPLDKKLLHRIFKKFNAIITVEDGCLQGGFGSAILEFMASHNYQKTIKRLGIPDEFIHHGTQEELRYDCKYDAHAIIAAVHKILANKQISQVG